MSYTRTYGRPRVTTKYVKGLVAQEREAMRCAEANLPKCEQCNLPHRGTGLCWGCRQDNIERGQ